MKVMLKILKVLGLLGVGGGIGYLAGYKRADGIRDEELKDVCSACRSNCDNCEIKKMYDEIEQEVQNEIRTAQDAEGARREYEGAADIQADTDDDPEMPEEEPRIGDEEELGNDPAPIIEFITEDEYYRGDGTPQETLIFYTVDRKIWNQDTRSQLNDSEILKCLGSSDGDGVGRTYFWRDATGNVPGERFIRNNMLGYKFRIDRIDAAFTDEHGDTSESYEEEDG